MIRLLGNRFINTLFCVLCLFTTSVMASSTEQPFTVEPMMENVNLIPYLEHQALQGEQSISSDDLSDEYFNSRFVKVENEDANFGYDNRTHWFRFSIQDPSLNTNELSHWYLEVDYHFLDRVEAFLPTQSGGYESIVVGDALPFNDRPVGLSAYVFPFTLSSSEPHFVYFKVTTSTSVQFPLQLWSKDAYLEHIGLSQYWLGIFIGIMVAMLLYNAFVFISVKDIAYFYYICYIASVIVINMILPGIAYQKLWPFSPFLANFGFPIVAGITMFFALRFARNFLELRKHSIVFDNTLRGFEVSSIVVAILPFVIGQFYSTLISVFMPILVSLIIAAAGIYGMFINHRRAIFFVLAWGTLIIGFIARALVQFDLLPVNILTLYGTQIGSIAEVILLSLALADRINITKAEKLAAVRESLDALEEKQKAESDLHFQSRHDQLTGAPNRSVYLQAINDCIETNDSNTPILICTLHLSNFQDINFTLGHQSGDTILVESINRLNNFLMNYPGVQLIEKNDGAPSYISMLEGVYFGFILKSEPSKSEHEILEPLINYLSQAMSYQEMSLDLGSHLGVANWPEDDHTAVGLTRKSMIAVQAAKWSKIPLVCYDANADRYSQSRLGLMGELITAIEQNQLVLHYQPKVDLRSGKVVSMEALVRWQHPKLGLLGPGHFIDLAESTGVIQLLTQWVLDKALCFCSQLRNEGIDISVAINISVRNLLNDKLKDTIINATQKYSVPSDKLILEVIESAVIEDMDQAVKTLEELKAEGVEIALDDFGTGYSSLTYLKNLPFSELKLDRSFVINLINDKDDEVIVNTTIAIAKQLKLRVVAEGIENAETEAKLSKLGCDIGQGFHIQKPIPEDEFKRWVHLKGFEVLNETTEL